MTKPTTTAGTPDDGASVNEASRVLYQTNQFDSTGYGLYLQDLVQIAPHWKLLAGLRYDNLSGDYSTFTLPTAAAGPVTTASYQMKVAEISKRVGVDALVWAPTAVAILATLAGLSVAVIAVTAWVHGRKPAFY